MGSTPVRNFRKALGAGVALTLGAGLAFSTGADALTLGHVAPSNEGGCTSCDVFQLRVDAGAPKYRVPAGSTGLWTITSWSAEGGGSADGKARIRVYRRTQTNGQFEIVKQSGLKLIPKNGSPFFATSLDVKAGDLLGLGTDKNVPSGYNPAIAGTVDDVFCDPTGVGQLVGRGTTCPLGDLQNSLVNVAAKLAPR